MSAAMPVIVTETFKLRPGEGQSWADVGRAIRRAALGNAACVSFRLMRDRRNQSLAVLLSEWTSIQEFNRFVRESGVLWLERGVHPSLAGTWSILEPDDVVEARSEATVGQPAKKRIEISGIGGSTREKDTSVRI